MAFTFLADGTMERYHLPLLDTCHQRLCTRRHATVAELSVFADEDRERGFREGVDHR
jgi:hypothetical protein